MPVLVHIVHYEQPQSLQPEKAEMLLGYPLGATAGHAVAPIQQLCSLGDSWDNCASLMLNGFSRYATICIEGQMEVGTIDHNTSAKHALLVARAQGGPDAIVQLLAELTMDEQLQLLQLLKEPSAPGHVMQAVYWPQVQASIYTPGTGHTC